MCCNGNVFSNARVSQRSSLLVFERQEQSAANIELSLRFFLCFMRVQMVVEGTSES